MLKVVLCIMALAPFSQSLKIEKKPINFREKGASGMDQMLKRLQNPAGCFERTRDRSTKDFPAKTEGGFYPVEDFKDMLANRKGNLDGHAKGSTDIPFCPEPSSELIQRDPEVKKYLEEAMKGTDSSKPLIMAVTDIHAKKDYHRMGILNFICGLKRLGVEQQTLIFTLDEQSAVTIRKEHPELNVLWHPSLMKTMREAGQRTGIYESNRVAKLVFADWLVHLDRQVIMSDLDAHWIQDPSAQLQAMTSQGKELDFAAMKDLCWLELNSGFLYYRPTNQTKELLRMALMTKHVDHLISDNDQYLLNCGLARAAVKGLNYKILPTDAYTFAFHGNLQCHAAYPEFVKEYKNDPVIWHTAEFSTSYEHKIDAFVALGAIDFDADTGKCLPGKRGSQEDIQKAKLARSLSCDTGPNGIMHGDCRGSCKVQPEKAQKLLKAYNEGSVSFKQKA